MYKIDKEIKTKLTEKEIKKKLYNISSKKRRSSGVSQSLCKPSN